MSKHDDEATLALLGAVKSTLYSAYALILEGLLRGDDGDAAANAWLDLTARGMNLDAAALAAGIYRHISGRSPHRTGNG